MARKDVLIIGAGPSGLFAAAKHVRRVRVYGPEMSELSGLDFEGIDCRCEFQCSLPQYETQRILEAHLASLGGVVERGGSRRLRWSRMRTTSSSSSRTRTAASRRSTPESSSARAGRTA